jgi:MFS family permease
MATPSQDPQDPLAHESTPLITTSRHTPGFVDQPSTPKPTKQYRRVLILLCIVLVLVQCGDELSASPNARIAEAIICYRHYESADPAKLLIDRATIGPGAIGGVAEITCKVEAVQSQLSSLRGYQGFLNGLPSLVLALPFGWAADKYGRKPFFFLGALSFVVKAVWIQIVCWFWQSFDIRWTWASALHGLMAGSSPVVSALFFVIVSDIVPETDRSKVFLRLGGVNLISAVCMPLLSAWLMEFTPWIPSIGGTIFQIGAVFVTLIMPETLGFQQSPEEFAAAEQQEEATETPSSSSLKNSLTKLLAAIAFIWTDWRIPALVLSFLIHLAVIDSPPLQLQYVSTRYHLTFAEATTILTLRSVANIALLFVVLPLTAKFLTKRWGLCGQRTNLWMARASMASWALGWLVFGLSPTLLAATAGMGMTALGSGSFFLIRSFLTPLVPGHNVARLYSLISVVDTIGAMLGTPLLASLFNRGLSIGGYGVGLPFYVLSLACLTITVLLCVVELRKGEDASGEGTVTPEGE